MNRIILLVIALIAMSASVPAARTWIVDQGGTGDALTIQAGIDSAVVGDTVIVRCDTYYEHDIVMKSGVLLKSETSLSDCVTIDAQGLGRVFICDANPSGTRIKGFTIKGGHAVGIPPSGTGGAVYITNGGEPYFTRCDLIDNIADGAGGAVGAYNSAPGFTYCRFSGNHAGTGGGAINFSACPLPNIYDCVFRNNSAVTYGGAVYCWNSSSPSVSSCTFVNNSAFLLGAAFYLSLNSQPTLTNCVIAFNAGGQAIYCGTPGEIPSLSCCDLYGNSGGDWVGLIADQDTANGNFSSDPLFCDTTSMEPTIEDCSPCLEGNHPRGYDCGYVVGSSDVGCACGEATEVTSWGTIKSMYK